MQLSGMKPIHTLCNPYHHHLQNFPSFLTPTLLAQPLANTESPSIFIGSHCWAQESHLQTHPGGRGSGTWKEESALRNVPTPAPGVPPPGWEMLGLLNPPITASPWWGGQQFPSCEGRGTVPFGS